MKPELVIFDMDGTILDTLEDLKESLNAALAANGFPKRTLEETRRFVGNGIAKLMERAVPVGTSPEVTAKVLADFKVLYAAHCADHTRPYAGVPELLADLRAAGVLTAVVSNKADFAVQILARDYFPGLFDCVLGEKEGIAKKPAPDMVNAVLHTLNIAPAAARYVGDSEVDVETARNSGIAGVFVTWGFRPVETLREAGATVLADTPAELSERLFG